MRKFEAERGLVLQVVDPDENSFAIKVIEKNTVTTPSDLEGIYREYRFLTEIMRHPHIIRCLGMLHSISRVYLIFEFAGNQNLKCLLTSQPGQRVDVEDALNIFEQIGQAVAHCHSSDVTHRAISHNHVVLSPGADAQAYHCRLVDFHGAMIARGATTSRTVFGKLPCIAPEMALGAPYVPRLVDCWST